ncbi:MAG: hypothetical protein GY746_16115, partial [Gammaproteobacteria bacterium]|nr:hypothetical protein [Gammaproteobacteria bacterium]
MFIRNKNNNGDLLVIYVDDILVTSTAGVERTEEELNELESLYEIKRLGKATHILGIGVNQEGNQITLQQHAYLEMILDEAGYLDEKPRGTPWNAYQVSRENELDPTWAALYRRVTCQLMYLANGTRPDISYTVSRLASNMKTPNERDWQRTKRAL